MPQDMIQQEKNIGIVNKLLNSRNYFDSATKEHDTGECRLQLSVDANSFQIESETWYNSTIFDLFIHDLHPKLRCTTLRTM